MPPCFNSDEEWQAWRRAAVLSRINPDFPHSYCQDCRHEYKAAMVRAGRCGNVEGTIVPADAEEEDEA